jgi:hypothetical protein
VDSADALPHPKGFSIVQQSGGLFIRKNLNLEGNAFLYWNNFVN